MNCRIKLNFSQLCFIPIYGQLIIGKSHKACKQLYSFLMIIAEILLNIKRTYKDRKQTHKTKQQNKIFTNTPNLKRDLLRWLEDPYWTNSLKAKLDVLEPKDTIKWRHLCIRIWTSSSHMSSIVIANSLACRLFKLDGLLLIHCQKYMP